MTCPECGPLATAIETRNGVAVCGTCGATYTAGGHATHRDIDQLSQADEDALRAARRRVVPLKGRQAR